MCMIAVIIVHKAEFCQQHNWQEAHISDADMLLVARDNQRHHGNTGPGYAQNTSNLSLAPEATAGLFVEVWIWHVYKCESGDAEE